MAHKNYKQKWLEALDQHRKEPVQSADDTRTKAHEVLTTHTDASLALRKIGSSVGEVANAAKAIVSEMDEHRNVAGLEFGEVSAEIDTKLARMPVHVALRRVRDLLKIAEARIAMLHIQADDLFIANTTLTESMNRTQASQKNIHRALMDTTWVGPNPTQAEIDDFTDAAAGEYHRDGLVYSDDPDEFIMTRLFAKTSLRTVSPKDEGLTDGESSDESDDDTTSRRRLAQIVPASPIRNRTKIDI